MKTVAQETVEHRLTLPEVLKAMVEDGYITSAESEPLMADRRAQRPDHHPLIVIADQKWKSAKDPAKILNLDMVTEWMAGRVGLPYFHIDPLKINVSAVTEVFSSAYAARFKILPVGITNR
jgi:general secretion pathway protein E